MKKGFCKTCEVMTDNVFNIKLRPVAICEDCAKQIFIQQAKFYYNAFDVTSAIESGQNSTAAFHKYWQSTGCVSDIGEPIFELAERAWNAALSWGKTNK